MHTQQEIFDTVKNILITDFECEPAKVILEAKLVEDLDLDSIDAVDLVVRLQKLINKRVNPDDFKQIRTLKDVIVVIEKIVNE